MLNFTSKPWRKRSVFSLNDSLFFFFYCYNIHYLFSYSVRVGLISVKWLSTRGGRRPNRNGEKRGLRDERKGRKRERYYSGNISETHWWTTGVFCVSQTVFFSGETGAEGSEDTVWTGGLLCGGRGRPGRQVGQHVQRQWHRGQGGAGLDRKGEWDSVRHPDRSSNTGGPIQVGIPERRRPRLHQLGVDVWAAGRGHHHPGLQQWGHTESRLGASLSRVTGEVDLGHSLHHNGPLHGKLHWQRCYKDYEKCES